MQLVQTRTRLLAPLTLALTDCRFTFQRRRVVLWAWEILLPNCGPLPQRSHLAAMTVLLQSFVAGTPRLQTIRLILSLGGVGRREPPCHTRTNKSYHIGSPGNSPVKLSRFKTEAYAGA